MTESEAFREELVKLARQMLALGLVTGTSGNLSARIRNEDGEPYPLPSPARRGEGDARARDLILITPSGVDYGTMRPGDLVPVDLDGNRLGEGLAPSVDTMNHLAIYRARPEVASVIHTHSPYAAAFSVLRQEIPPLLAEAAGYLGGAVRVLEYLPPASPDLASRVAAGLGEDRAVLLPNHGVVAVGENPGKAFHAAVVVEESARVAFIALQMGNPSRVPETEVQRMHEFIHQRYGQR